MGIGSVAQLAGREKERKWFIQSSRVCPQLELKCPRNTSPYAVGVGGRQSASTGHRTEHTRADWRGFQREWSLTGIDSESKESGRSWLGRETGIHAQICF